MRLVGDDPQCRDCATPESSVTVSLKLQLKLIKTQDLV